MMVRTDYRRDARRSATLLWGNDGCREKDWHLFVQFGSARYTRFQSDWQPHAHVGFHPRPSFIPSSLTDFRQSNADVMVSPLKSTLGERRMADEFTDSTARLETTARPTREARRFRETRPTL